MEVSLIDRMISWRLARRVFLFVILVELISLASQPYSEVRNLAFGLIVFLTLVIALKRLDYALWILLAELVIGSKGYLIAASWDGNFVPIRVGIFLVVLSIWLAKLATPGGIKRARETLQALPRWIFVLAFFVVLGTVRGFILGNEAQNVFFNVNNWFYFALFPVFVDVIRTKESVRDALSVITGSLVAVALKTLVILFIFSHQMIYVNEVIYHWVRRTGVGEIAAMGGGFYRVFSQTHVWPFLFFLVFFAIAVYAIQHENDDRRSRRILWWMISVCASVVVVSLSRSFWLAGAVSALIFLMYELRQHRRHFGKTLGYLVTIGIAAVLFVGAIVYFPFPRPAVHDGYSLADLLSDRATDTGESALGSRWNLLPVLWSAVRDDLLLGAGFGKTLTYETKDPLNRELNVGGTYTHYAFEWGWLDLWLKMGIGGMLAYLILIIMMEHRILRTVRTYALRWEGALLLGMGLSVLALALVHVTTPYLDHPLGIGFLMISFATARAFDVDTV